MNEQNATAEQYGDSIGEYTIDYYCSCETCRAKASKVKATGTPVVEGQTIAVDPDEIPYGTKVIIDGHVFTAKDNQKKEILNKKNFGSLAKIQNIRSFLHVYTIQTSHSPG